MKLVPFLAHSDVEPHSLTRREFLGASALIALAAATPGCGTTGARREEIIDIHQHAGYSGRTNEELVAHQDLMGVRKTILLPAGRPMNTSSTHGGAANGLQARALGNEECFHISKAFPRRFYFAANEVPDAPGAVREIEKYLKLGAVAIAEQKYGVECDSPEMQRLYELAAAHRVPILLHFQHGMYNHGFERFGKMLEKHPKTIFIGHAQTWWANIDKGHHDQAVLYPRTRVTPGGLTDRYLSDYPNLYADLSAGSGLNAMKRDEDHARGFLERHQDKILFGSDCNDRPGGACQGRETIATVKRLAPTPAISRKILSENAKRVFRI